MAEAAAQRQRQQQRQQQRPQAPPQFQVNLPNDVPVNTEALDNIFAAQELGEIARLPPTEEGRVYNHVQAPLRAPVWSATPKNHEWLLQTLLDNYVRGVPSHYAGGWMGARRAPDMFQIALKNPEAVWQVQQVLEGMGIHGFQPNDTDYLPAKGAENTAFHAGERVVKLGDPALPYNRPFPQNLWGVNPAEKAWVQDNAHGRPVISVNVQPRVLTVHPVWGKPTEIDVRTLSRALNKQGYVWSDSAVRNMGFMPGQEYLPRAFDGMALPRQQFEATMPDMPAQEATFVPPTGPSWNYNWLPPVLAGLTAAGATAMGGAASAATPVAGSNEDYKSYLQRMQPRRFGGRGTPEPTALPYSFNQLRGVAAPLSDYSHDFPEKQEWARLVTDTFLNSRVIRGESGLMTPAEYALSLAGTANDGSEHANLIKSNVLSAIVNGEGDNMLAKEVLLALKASGQGGADSLPTGQTEADREARRTSPWQETRYMTSPNMDQNLLATDAFNLMSALQTDPEVRAPYRDAGSGVLGGIGSVYNTFVWPAGETADETRDLEDMRNELSQTNPVQSAVKEALYWQKKAKEGRESGRYRTSTGGGFRPQHSWTTLQGMANQGEDDLSNVNAQWNRIIPQALSGTPVFTRDQSGPLLRHLMTNYMRESPVLAPGMTPEEGEELKRDITEYANAQERQYINEYPVRQRVWNDKVDQLGVLGDYLKVDKFSYPSQANNLVANSPKYWLDAPTALTLGAFAVPSIAKAGMVNFGKAVLGDFVADQPFEQAFGVGASLTQEPYSSKPSKLLEAIGQGDVLDETGKPADPNAGNYTELLRRHQEEQKKKLGRILQKGLKHYPQFQTPPANPNPAPWSGMPTGKM